jgi:endonuclease/exonuclease/phosphatase family metal-dependent hydrolase
MARRQALKHPAAGLLAATVGLAVASIPGAALASPVAHPGTRAVPHTAIHLTSPAKHKPKKHKYTVPAAPAHIKIVKVSTTGFTVSIPTRGKSFKVFASANHQAMSVDAISHSKSAGKGAQALHKSRLTHSRTVSVSGLTYTTSPYYFRAEAFNGPKHRWGSLSTKTVQLLPAEPTHVAATSTTSGLSLNWRSGSATGYRITQATDSAMSQDVTTYNTLGPDTTFTPYGLTSGTTYYFTVRSLNGLAFSKATTPVSATAGTSGQDVRVMTYNILEGSTAGTTEDGSPLASWADRRAGVAQMIEEGAPDVASIQEAATYAGDPALKIRQIDDLVTELGPGYTLADTEIPPSMPGYFRTGDYIIYNPNTLSAVGTGGHFSLPDTHFAAYQVLQNISSGAQFLFVAPHLIVGKSAAFDQEREDEATSMVAQANAIAQPLGIPVIYAGDFNSDTDLKQHTFDGPGIVMKALAYDDSYQVAQTRTNAKYDSANQNLRTPAQSQPSQRIDEIYVPPGVGVKAWVNKLDLTNGKFVGVIPSDHNAVYADVVIPYV